MSDQQPKFDTATFSPSPFDTFQVPISDVVTQSIEDVLAGGAPADAETPANPEVPATQEAEPAVAEQPAAAEEVASVEAVCEEIAEDEQETMIEAVATEQLVNVPEPVAEAPVQEVAEQIESNHDEKTSAMELVEAPAEEHLVITPPQPAVQEVVAERISETPEPPVVSEDVQDSVEVIEPEVVAEQEVVTKPESSVSDIDDVLIPPPVVAIPEKPAKPVQETPVEIVARHDISTVAPVQEIQHEIVVKEDAPKAQPVREAEPEVVANHDTPNAKPGHEKPTEVVARHDAPNTQPVSEKQPKAVTEEPATSGFRALELREEVQQAIELSGYTTPTDIQAEIIPHVLAGRDVLAQSQTGTGKTAAFALPILSKINVAANKPQVLVLAPTRELAMQVADSFTTYGKQIPRLDVAAVYGGQGYDTQLRQLRRGVPIVVGTPGRVIDHIKRRTLDLSELECLVLDEADEMLNMGFLEDVKFVLEQTPAERQVALFSATLPGPIQKIAQQYLNDPVRITIKRKTMTADAIRQRAVFAAHRDKLDVLSRFLDVEETDGVIIFTKTREATVTVAEHLVREGFKAVALNGDMAQNVRERTISQLKASRLDIVVATDVAARGLDVSRISHVFNFDVPQDTESYVHRIGRTGRAGRKGEAIILLSNSQRFKLKQIERLTKQRIEVVAAPTTDDINAARVVRFKQKITEVAEKNDLSQFTQILTEYATESGKPFEVIAAALAEIMQNGRPFFVQELRGRNNRGKREEGFQRDDRGPSRDRRDRDERPSRQPRRAGRVEAGMDRYRIEVGHEDGVKPGNIVGAVANEGGIEGEFIGPINIFDNYSTIDLPEGMPREVYDVLQQVRVAGKQLRIRRATEGDSHGETGGGGGGRNFKPRGQKRFGGKGRSGGPGGSFDSRKKRRPRN